MKLAKGLIQAYELQDLTFNAAMSMEESLKNEKGKLDIQRDDAMAIAGLVKSWDAVTERIRIIRGTPLPGSLRPKSKPERRHKRQPTIEPANVVDYVEEKPTSGIQSTEPPQAQAGK